MLKTLYLSLAIALAALVPSKAVYAAVACETMTVVAAEDALDERPVAVYNKKDGAKIVQALITVINAAGGDLGPPPAFNTVRIYVKGSMAYYLLEEDGCVTGLGRSTYTMYEAVLKEYKASN